MNNTKTAQTPTARNPRLAELRALNLASRAPEPEVAPRTVEPGTLTARTARSLSDSIGQVWSRIHGPRHGLVAIHGTHVVLSTVDATPAQLQAMRDEQGNRTQRYRFGAHPEHSGSTQISAQFNPALDSDPLTQPGTSVRQLSFCVPRGKIEHIELGDVLSWGRGQVSYQRLATTTTEAWVPRSFTAWMSDDGEFQAMSGVLLHDDERRATTVEPDSAQGQALMAYATIIEALGDSDQALEQHALAARSALSAHGLSRLSTSMVRLDSGDFLIGELRLDQVGSWAVEMSAEELRSFLLVKVSDAASDTEISGLDSGEEEDSWD